ncbi:putative ubiquinol-cytochrome c reductase complex 11 kDa protein [Tilletiaria anomala UBC 951]|uniref:Cytochrome b-c1 complex subunit 8 n=1 Tax=Tilletiaria anomala (strain ATCC 24038 / CBS 436.72 / UBC 951) TaxID=1037660 RepID=A0A066VDA1_TILAU|nr:putative ubiquinol-cytochrome c reductase complex 11 kDa protein [Tilletiaria anomala UBC 951]KDN38268.1 putative ubiquinol-cytochrome c reductase complex 11 kDa protein [Tilletiaria anomala UBC 951]
MHPTTVARSAHMPTGNKWLGWWGDFGGPKQRGVTQYSLSPVHTSPTRGALKDAIFFGYRRVLVQAPYFLIPFAAGYGLIAWAKEKNTWYNSKEGHLATGGHEE